MSEEKTITPEELTKEQRAKIDLELAKKLVEKKHKEEERARRREIIVTTYLAYRQNPDFADFPDYEILSAMSKVLELSISYIRVILKKENLNPRKSKATKNQQK